MNYNGKEALRRLELCLGSFSYGERRKLFELAGYKSSSGEHGSVIRQWRSREKLPKDAGEKMAKALKISPDFFIDNFVEDDHLREAIRKACGTHKGIVKIPDIVQLQDKLFSVPSETVNPILENNTANHIAQINAAEWASNGYKYHVVEKIGKELLAEFRDPSDCHIDFDEHTNILLLVASIHFGTYWCHWVKSSKDNISAVKVLFRVLDIPYVRPRLRTLYALQLFTGHIVQKALREQTENISENNIKLIQSYVLTKRVMDYLLKITKHRAIGKKSEMVIREVVDQGQEEVQGYDSPGLPII